MNTLLVLLSLAAIAQVGVTRFTPWLRTVAERCGGLPCAPDGADWRFLILPWLAAFAAWGLAHGANVEARAGRPAAWAYNGAGLLVVVGAWLWAVTA